MYESERPLDWHRLCELASKEQDPEKLLELIRRLNRALDEKLNRQQRNYSAS
jgi:hypothetical protein